MVNSTHRKKLYNVKTVKQIVFLNDGEELSLFRIHNKMEFVNKCMLTVFISPK